MQIYPQEIINFSKGVIRSKTLSFTIPKEIQTSLGKQSVMVYKRITIRRGGEKIQMHAYILTFNKFMIPKEIKIRYYLEKIKQYIPTPFKCFKCKKYGHPKESCIGCPTYGRCIQKDPDHMAEDCPNETKCSNCQENCPAFSRTCTIYKNERKIMEVKYRRNITFLKGRKIVESDIKKKKYLHQCCTEGESNQL